MSGRVLQRLLAAGEYDEFEDVVMAEGEFIEQDRHHNAVRQVTMGITSRNLLIASRNIVDYKLNSEVYYQTDFDPYLDGLEMSTVWPLCLIRLAVSAKKFELIIKTNGFKRYYQLTNTHTNGNLGDTWAKWQERVVYLREDPYGYMKSMYDEYNLPYPEYLLKPEEKQVENALVELNTDAVDIVEEVDIKPKAKKSDKKKKKRKFLK